MGTFSLLFSIYLEHRFFAEHCCRHFELTPTIDCQKIMSNTGIMAKRDFRGIHLFYDDEKTDALRLFAADSDEPLHFFFKAYSRDTQFCNYTDLPPQIDDAVFYLHNTNASTGASDPIALHQGEFVSGKDLQRISSLLPGSALSKKEKMTKPFFVIDIFAGQSGDRLFDEHANVSPKAYVVKFKNRETHWKYFLLNDLAKEGNYIEDANNRTVFEKSSEAELQSQKPTLIYRSKTPIPLQEKSEYVFQLKERNAGNGRTLIKRLPVASADQLSREVVDTDEVIVSEIFINR